MIETIKKNSETKQGEYNVGTMYKRTNEKHAVKESWEKTKLDEINV